MRQFLYSPTKAQLWIGIGVIVALNALALLLIES
jgi:hypothetical protein